MNSVPPSENGPADTPSGEPGEMSAADVVDQGLARIIELEKQLEEAKKERLLALAEAENAGRRADRRIADNAKYAVSNICKALVQVADNLGRALMAAPADARAHNDAVKNLATGVELTEKELLAVLESNGVRRINSLNQPFDANFHNAVQEVENTSVPSGTVVQVFQEGYVIHDRLLRPAMVVVSRGGPRRETKPEGKNEPPQGVNTTA